MTRATKNTKERVKGLNMVPAFCRSDVVSMMHVFGAESHFNCLRKRAKLILMASVNTIIASTSCHQSKHKAA
eukprot:scaffold155945_cov40-Cyclotella_meneghiniana.AAC.1